MTQCIKANTMIDRLKGKGSFLYRTSVAKSWHLQTPSACFGAFCAFWNPRPPLSQWTYYLEVPKKKTERKRKRQPGWRSPQLLLHPPDIHKLRNRCVTSVQNIHSGWAQGGQCQNISGAMLTSRSHSYISNRVEQKYYSKSKPSTTYHCSIL